MTLSTARLKASTQHTGRAGWLGLAAAPTFAAMSCVSALGTPGMAICSATASLLPINDMALMYLMMSIFHLAPWLELRSAHVKRRTTPTIQTEGH